MRDAKPPTFSPTFRLWAARPDSLPMVWAFPVQLVGDVITYSGLAGEEERMVELPDEFVLREVLDADPADPVAFINQWGLLLHGETIDEFDQQHFGVSLPDAIRAMHELRVLAKWWVAAVEGDEQEMTAAFTSENFTAPSLPAGGAVWWHERMNTALAAFPMRIEVEWGSGDAARSLAATGQPTLYEVAALQLALIAAGGRPLTRCANLNCGRAFTVQRTSRRAYKGTEHATGVKYCSERCAKAQSERERRARRRVEGKRP